jgi:hypothetical protein
MTSESIHASTGKQIEQQLILISSPVIREAAAAMSGWHSKQGFGIPVGTVPDFTYANDAFKCYLWSGIHFTGESVYTPDRNRLSSTNVSSFSV